MITEDGTSNFSLLYFFQCGLLWVIVLVQANRWYNCCRPSDTYSLHRDRARLLRNLPLFELRACMHPR
ncbi:hypothetical protein BDN70DRAFT_446577 [Pholiota conissans]|uniref:Uncharacterized protein n=1 Tax=Pholiota conissans TaxID=109636 RepID=A0A9P5YQ38_9AGAR|nr:hypothetical protein BDN70DRAFT_446577 [Pholiota conissans]